MSAPILKYTPEESERANTEWEANCGPHSLAAALGLSLDAVRIGIPDFRGLMNPTEMSKALVNFVVPAVIIKDLQTKQLCNGINRIQWEGPWMKKVGRYSAMQRYANTHWVAHIDGWVLCTFTDPETWIPIQRWREFLIATSSPWHVTHYYQIPQTHLAPFPKPEPEQNESLTKNVPVGST